MYKVAVEKSDDYSFENINRALDKMFEGLGFDVNNPFSSFISEGMTVFIKPNWVASRWRASCEHTDTIYSVITHPNVIEAIADRVALALNGKGRIIIGDNPSIDADFDELMELTGIKRLENKYSVPCEIIDMRPLVCTDLQYYGQLHKMKKCDGDPRGNVEVNLGSESLLYEVDSTLFRGVFNERDETVKSHTGTTQLYTYGRSLYDADVYISIPKLKTHQKVGATLNLKGLVGSITQKNQLVHWRVGTPETGGDEYPNQEALEAAKNAKVTHRGAWPGNDTIWRMVVDLYQGMLKKDRKYFSIIDGIIAGEGKGPFCPHSKDAGILIAGDNLLSTDIVAARLMGLNPQKIKYMSYFVDKGVINLKDISVISGVYENDIFDDNSKYLDFKVEPMWSVIKY